MSGKKWILLVSGSKGWENYKHQANVCLHYQLIKRHGIPDKQIVVMMYDDIAHNPNNSKCNGKISSIIDGQDVYSGVPKDYTGADVTQNNFLSALRGVERKDKKKVIASGPNDNIYIYMTGVGQDSGFQFPEKALNAKAFTDVLKNMHAGKKFSKMVIFMDSDYSGLMFEGLPRSIDIFALASCHKYVQNTPTNYDKEREVFASDLFSKTWLTYLNGVNFAKDTFKDLVEDKQPSFKEDEACPNRFGDEKIIKCHLSEFLQKH